MILARKYFDKKIFNRIFAVTVGLAEMLQRGWTGRHSLLVKMIFFLPCSIVFLLLNSQKMKAICNANASNHISYYDDEKIKNWLSAMGSSNCCHCWNPILFIQKKKYLILRI